MSSADEDTSSQTSSVYPTDDGAGNTDIASLKAKINGMSDDSAAEGSAAETNGETNGTSNGHGEVKENGVDHHASEKSSSSSSSHKHGDGHRSSSSHKSSSSDKHKHSSSSSSSKHREGGSSSSSSKHKDGSSSSSSKHRDGHSSSSSSSKHRDGHSSSSSKHGSSSSSSKHSSSSSSKHKDGHSSSSSSSKHKDGSSSSSSKHRDGSSSSSSKHKDGSSSSSSKDKSSSSSSSHRDKDKSSSSSSHRDKDKSSSSSSHRDKDKSSSSSHRDKSGSSKDKSSSSSSHDKHRDKSKDGSSSSSSKDKSHSSSSSKDKSHSSSSKHRDDKHKSSSSSKSSGDRESSKESPVKVKEEVKEEVKAEASSDEYTPDVSRNDVKMERDSPVKAAVKSEDEESDDEEDVPLSVRKKVTESSRPNKRVKEEVNYGGQDDEDEDEESEEDVPLSARANKAKKIKLEKPVKKEKVEPKPVKKAPVSPQKKVKKEAKPEPSEEPPKKKKKGEEAEGEVWKWWEEEKKDTGVKWNFLEHKGPIFAPEYERLPSNVKFYYDGKPMDLAEDTEEVATFYGKMLDHDYTTKDVFNNNFWKDWRKIMTEQEKKVITDLKKCNFHEINEHFKRVSEARKARSKEEKKAEKEKNEELTKKYGVCVIDHHEEKIGNFRIEPPGLFRGRGDHPKQGKLKTRTFPEQVIINCSKDSKIPEPPTGHRWKEVRHDNTVTWLASWNENIQNATKYVMLNPASKLKGEKDMMKYELARKLHRCVDKIRAQYQEDWKSKEMRIRQRAVALYFIDKLALRAGNEKDGDETADTVGCCSLRVEHITLHPEKDKKNYVVEFDFLGKDSIRYLNSIPVEKRVYKNVELFMENKAGEDDLFDRLNTSVLNKHLQDLMEGLTAKVFRTYNASRTLSEQLELLTNPDDGVPAKILSYNRANRAVAILCNHQRAVPKSFEKSMENLQNKIEAKKNDIKQVKKDIKGIKAEYKQQKSVKTKTLYEKKKKTLQRLEEQLIKLEVQATDKDENKEIALGTSKLNYLDPRISVAWCKKFDVPIEKVYNKTQRDKFRWAIDMATEHFKF